MACCCHCAGFNLDTSPMHPWIFLLPLLVDGGGMVFDRSAEVRPGIEEVCGSGVVLCEELDDCWISVDKWVELINESFNGGVTGITIDDNLFLFELLSLQLKHLLSRVWMVSIPFGRGMMNAILVCIDVVCMLFCLLMANKRWDPTFLCENYSNVWVSVPGIKLITSFLSQHN